MESKNEEVVSTQKSLQPSHDPGWNDPPAWALTAAQNRSDTSSKRLLNKRVAFPLSSNSVVSNMVSNDYMPQYGSLPSTCTTNSFTTAPHKPMTSPRRIMQDEDSNSGFDYNSEEILKENMHNFKTVIDVLDPTKSEDIKKRLDKMEVMWKEDKFDRNVQKKITNISKALVEGDLDAADEAHVSLMVNNANICSSWVPGIRQLIGELKLRKN